MCVYIYVCIYICIYTHTHTHIGCAEDALAHPNKNCKMKPSKVYARSNTYIYICIYYMYIGWADDAVARLNKNWKIGTQFTCFTSTQVQILSLESSFS